MGKRAFIPTELVVVIAIIGILAIVLLPPLSKARGAAVNLNALLPEWSVIWGGAYNDSAWDVIEHNGSLYVTGTTEVSSTNMDMFIRKYDLNGILIWEKTWDSGPKDAGFVIVAGGSFLYVGGYTQVENINKALLQKRDLDGNIIWSKTWGEISNGHHEVDGIAIVGDYVYVSHWDATWLFENVNAVVKKFDSNGEQLWSTTWGNLGGKQDTVDGHIYANSTGVWVSGRIDGDFFAKGSAYLTKIDPNGSQLWLKKWGGNTYDQALNLSSDGNYVYLSGWTDSFAESGFDAFLLKYDMNGKLKWSITQGSSLEDRSRGISAVDSRYVYMSMYTKSYGAGEGDTILQIYNKNTGKLLNQSIWGGTGDDDLSTSIYVDTSYVYMVGKTSSSGAGGYDAILMKVLKPSVQ